MTLFWWLEWSCRDFMKAWWQCLWKMLKCISECIHEHLGPAWHCWMLVIVSPHITHPVIMSRQVQAICFFLRTNLYKPREGELPELSFSRVLQPFGLCLLQHAPVCSSGHGFIEKPFRSWVHVTIFEHAERAPTPYSLSCIKSILYQRCFSTDIDSSTVQYTKITLHRFMLSPANPCCLC